MLASESLPPEVVEYFPYQRVRPFQDSFIKKVYESISNGKSVAIEGANGLGKTVAVLSAVISLAKKEGYGILYCCRTHKQMDRVIEELKAISKRSKVTGISMRGRREMCLHPLILRHTPDAKAAMEVCEQLKEQGKCVFYENMDTHFERCSELQVLFGSKPFLASEIREVCKNEIFCPHELTKLIADAVDVVSLSYIYLFDPIVRNNFFRYYNKSLDEVILILDEAHNLPETATNIASDQLTTFTIQQAQREAKKYNYENIASFCKNLEKIVESLAEPVEEELSVPPALFIETFGSETRTNDLISLLDYMHVSGERIHKNLLLHGRYPRSHTHRVSEFLLKWIETTNLPSFSHVLSRYEARSGVVSLKLEIIALDSRKITQPVLSNVNCSISISGTLEPIEAYAKIIGLPSTVCCEALPSPFPEEHIMSLACLGVTTILDRRTSEMYRKLAKRASEVVRYTPANVGIFAASYDVLQGMLEAGFEDVIEKPLFYEKRAMSSRENDALLQRFRSYAERGGAVLLGVQGGKNSEGEDYPGNQMNSVVVVGVPYAKPVPRVNMQIQYYESQFPRHGQEYGYVIPALKKASQAAGRPVRTLEDRGAIIFLDYRFSTAYCRRYLPVWIRKNLKVLPDEEGEIARELILFFGFQTSK